MTGPSARICDKIILMTGMSESFLERQRQRLLEIKAELEAQGEVNKDAMDTVELDQSKVGRLSRMDAIQIQEMAKANEARRKLELKRIEAALDRLDAGNYGYCIATGEEIERKRLELDPTAPTAIGHSK